MSTVASNSRPRRLRGFVLSIAVVLVVGLSFIAISAVTAQATRANLQTQLADSSYKALKIQQVVGGWNWSRLTLRVDATGTLCEVNLQHYLFNTWVTGKLYNASNTSIATFTGRVDPTPWNNAVFTHITLSLAAGQWVLPTGVLKNGPVTLYAEVNRTLQKYDFEVKTVATNVHYQGIPVLNISSLVQQASGSLITETPKGMWWDAKLHLKADSDYGPLQVETQLIGPGDMDAMLQTGRMRIRTILPDKLWKLSELWVPKFADYLTKSGIMKSQGGLRITDALFQNGTWYAPTTADAPNTSPESSKL